jgi:hypothetical protein
MVFLSFLNKKRAGGMDKEFLRRLHFESISRIIDLLENGTDATVLNKSPL